jgi:hypothetical protein
MDGGAAVSDRQGIAASVPVGGCKPAMTATARDMRLSGQGRARSGAGARFGGCVAFVRAAVPGGGNLGAVVEILAEAFPIGIVSRRGR